MTDKTYTAADLSRAKARAYNEGVLDGRIKQLDDVDKYFPDAWVLTPEERLAAYGKLEDYIDNLYESLRKQQVTETITRLEVIDHTKDGRTVLVKPEDGLQVTYDLQDDGRTLKVFVTKPEEKE